MKRRACVLGCVALAAGAGAWGQTRPRVIAVLNGANAAGMSDMVEELRAGLAALGQLEGRDIELQAFWSGACSCWPTSCRGRRGALP